MIHMKQFFKRLMLTALVAVSIVACKDADNDEFTREYTSGTTLMAVTPTSSETKVSFTDNDSAGIDLSWEVGDIFTIYNSNEARIGNFTCTDIDSSTGNGTFENTDITLDGGTYTAVYPASTSSTLSNIADTVPLEQDGDQINNLDESCMMSAEFTYTSDKDVSIVFEHKKAVMTFSFASENRPSKLVFENGDETYTVTYTTIEPDNNSLYTSHIMIEPCDATSRTLVFTLYNSNEIAYDRRTAATTKAYLAGYRYTAPVSTNVELDEDTGIDIDIAYRSNTYEIYTGKGLQAFANLVNGVGSNPGANWKDYECNTDSNSDNSSDNFQFVTDTLININGKLMNDVSISGIGDNQLNSTEICWRPIAWRKAFAGTFDGGGHIVMGLYINAASSQLGLFGATAVGSVIKNLGVEGTITGTNTGGWEVAGIVANNYGEITDCYSKVEINAVGYTNVGGIAGHSFSAADIANSYNRGDISGYRNVGGVCGNCNGTMHDSYSTGSIEASYEYVDDNDESTKDDDDCMLAREGGVVGWFNNNTEGDLTNCYCLDTSSTYSIGKNGTSGVETSAWHMWSYASMTDGSFASTLGDAYKEDYTSNINGGYPILTWE